MPFGGCTLRPSPFGKITPDQKGEKMSVLSPSEEKRVYDNILCAIGWTPLVRLGRIAHQLGSGLELWEQTDGHLTDGVIGMGTGGTISRVGRYLKDKNPDIRRE